jgi:hypothetical protein
MIDDVIIAGRDRRGRGGCQCILGRFQLRSRNQPAGRPRVLQMDVAFRVETRLPDHDHQPTHVPLIPDNSLL